jgi:hypothetical protein
LGKFYSSQIPQQAVVHWLTSSPRIRFEPSIALNQRHENNPAQPQRGARMLCVGQTVALAKHKRSFPARPTSSGMCRGLVGREESRGVCGGGSTCVRLHGCVSMHVGV